MLNLSPVELLVVLTLGLIVLGPQKLPQVARQIGRVVQEVRRMAAGFQAEMRESLREADIRDEFRAAMADVDELPVSPQARPPLAPPPPSGVAPESGAAANGNGRSAQPGEDRGGDGPPQLSSTS